MNFMVVVIQSCSVTVCNICSGLIEYLKMVGHGGS